MQGSELEALLSDLESDRVERKRSAVDKDAIKKAICALANDLPGHNAVGVLFIGIEDNGDCAGLKIDDELLKSIASSCSDGSILPKPSCKVQRHSIRGCDVVVIQIDPALAPPVRHSGRTYVRLGPTTQVASPEQERRLSERRRSADLPFDLSPLLDAKLEDLDLDLFRDVYLPSAVASDVLEQNRRTREHQLMSLRMISRDAAHTPTVTGMLTIGRSPRDFVPSDYIQFLRIDGTTLADPIQNQHEISGPLPALLRQLDEILQIHISVRAVIVDSDRERRTADYPIAALHQMSRNAIMHRSYDGTNAPIRIYWFTDRIEIHSPGGPFGQVTRNNIGEPGITDYRNPHLAEVLKNLGYVQRFGAGFEIARRELSQNGNPQLEILAEESHVAVVVRSRFA